MNLINVLGLCTGVVGGDGIPNAIGGLINMGFMLLQVFVPIILIIWGMMDFAKAVMAQDAENIKKGQKTFIQRLIAAVVVFLIVTIVQLVINILGSVGGTDAQTAWSCAQQLINNKAD
jgi:large-conductance mechanosensitive channel